MPSSHFATVRGLHEAKSAWRQRLRWGIDHGFRYGLMLALFATLEYGLKGEARFQRIHLTYFSVLAYDLVGITAAGAMIGLLRPLARWPVGGAAIGGAVGLPIGLFSAASLWGLAPWTRFHTWLSVGGILWCGLLGTIWARLHYPRSRASVEDWG
jgi:hypothetical protein